MKKLSLPLLILLISIYSFDCFSQGDTLLNYSGNWKITRSNSSSTESFREFNVVSATNIEWIIEEKLTMPDGNIEKNLTFCDQDSWIEIIHSVGAFKDTVVDQVINDYMETEKRSYKTYNDIVIYNSQINDSAHVYIFTTYCKVENPKIELVFCSENFGLMIIYYSEDLISSFEIHKKK